MNMFDLTDKKSFDSSSVLDIETKVKNKTFKGKVILRSRVDGVHQLFNKAAGYLQSSYKWDKYDFLDAVFLLLPYMNFMRFSNDLQEEQAKDHVSFISKMQVAELQLGQKLTDQVVYGFKISTKESEKNYIFLVNNKFLLSHEGIVYKSKRKAIRFTCFRESTIIGKTMLVRRINELAKIYKNHSNTVNTSVFDLYLKTLLTGLISGMRSMNYQSYDTFNQAAYGSEYQFSYLKSNILDLDFSNDADLKVAIFKMIKFYLLDTYPFKLDQKGKRPVQTASVNLVMQSSPIRAQLHQYFEELQFTTGVDKEQFVYLAKELLRVMPLFPRISNLPILRIGHSKTDNSQGYYLPSSNLMIFNIGKAGKKMDISNFAFVYAKVIDYQYHKQNWTEELEHAGKTFELHSANDFQAVIDTVKEPLARLLEQGYVGEKRKDNLAADTIFDRAFVVYLDLIGLKTTLYAKTRVENDPFYRVLKAEAGTQILDYFSERFPRWTSFLAQKKLIKK